MFFIVNKTKQRIVLGDLNISLGPRQAIDLDKIVKRDKSDKSNHLILAVKRGDIEVRMKDSEIKTSIPETTPNKSSLDQIKDDIVSELKGSIQQLSQQLSSSNPKTQNIVLSDEDMKNLTQQIINNISSNVSNKKESLIPEEEVGMDDSIVADMNARAVNKMVKNSDIQSVKYKEDQQKDTILNNVSELEDLIG
jgi:hypothetical protein